MNLTEKRELTFALSRQPGITPRNYQQLLSEFSDIDQFFGKFEEKKKFPNLKFSWADLNNFDLPEIDFNYVCIWEDEYPELLTHISDPPIILFYLGDLSLANGRDNIGIVGTRKASIRASAFTESLVTDLLSLHDCNIVSGMAMGIDTVALKAATNQGRAIAVLGTPVNDPTPRQNFRVYREILDKGGLVVSEYLPDSEMGKWTFVQRNRIIAGMSKATLVVEAAVDSGSLITAQVAFENNREVLAVPGSIGYGQKLGTNMLIKRDVAKLCESAEDILAAIGVISVSRKLGKSPKLESLEPQTQAIFTLIESGMNTFDQILSQGDLPADEILPHLTRLELAGLISQVEDNSFIIN